MSVKRNNPNRQIHLARAARFAGEAFGHDPHAPGTIAESTSAPARSALSAMLMACVNGCRFQGHSRSSAGLNRATPQQELKVVRRKRWSLAGK